MGTRFARSCSDHLDVAKRERLSLEFSLAAFSPFGSRALRGRVFANVERGSEPSQFGGNRSGGARHRCISAPSNARRVCFSLRLDHVSSSPGVGGPGKFSPAPIAHVDAGDCHLRLVARNLLVYSTELRRSEVPPRSSADCARAARSATSLFECLP